MVPHDSKSDFLLADEETLAIFMAKRYFSSLSWAIFRNFIYFCFFLLRECLRNLGPSIALDDDNTSILGSRWILRIIGTAFIFSVKSQIDDLLEKKKWTKGTTVKGCTYLYSFPRVIFCETKKGYFLVICIDLHDFFDLINIK